jgi:polysaccharide pyruvyl transferase WcaK-like protein
MKALFILNGSSENRGCEAILISTWALLRQVDPQATAINSSLRDPRTQSAQYLHQPGLLHRCHPDPGSAQFLAWQWAKRVRGMQYNFERFLGDADIVMSLGGDNYSLDYNSVNKYLDGNERVLAAGKPLVIWGASVGPFTAEPEIEARVAKQFKRLALVVARERRTVAYLDSIGVRDNIMLLPDPAFSLNSAPVTLPAAQEKMLQAGAIGVNLSPLLARYRNGMDGWLEDATGWVRALMDCSGRPVLLVPHVFEPGNDDQAFMARLLERINATADRLALLNGRDLSCMQLKQVISRLHVFIGARTHATIAAMSRGVPTLSIGYSVKARGINEEVFGSTDWMVSHQGMDAATLVERYRTLDENAEQVREALAQRLTHYRMTAQDIRDLLARAIP